MYRLGITGGIGSGKTLVCSILEILGIPVYHADEAARRLMENEPQLVSGISILLGEEVYQGGLLDRKAVAEKVFRDRRLLQELNGLVHPAVREDFLAWESKQGEAPYVAEEAAIMFESGADRLMDLTVLVYAPEEMRISRVMQRDGSDREEVVRRMRSQMDEEEKKQRAGAVITNDGSDMLLPQVIGLHEKILNRK